MNFLGQNRTKYSLPILNHIIKFPIVQKVFSQQLHRNSFSNSKNSRKVNKFPKTHDLFFTYKHGLKTSTNLSSYLSVFYMNFRFLDFKQIKTIELIDFQLMIIRNGKMLHISKLEESSKEGLAIFNLARGSKKSLIKREEPT